MLKEQEDEIEFEKYYSSRFVNIPFEFLKNYLREFLRETMIGGYFIEISEKNIGGI